jgi:hypothetical protein
VKAAVEKALELSAVRGKATDLEKMYIAAIAARRDEKAKDQDEAFVKGLRAIAAKYPREIEARSYLALMIMRGFTLPEKSPKNATSMEAAAMLRDLMREAPDHPGVHHYVSTVSRAQRSQRMRGRVASVTPSWLRTSRMRCICRGISGPRPDAGTTL